MLQMFQFFLIKLKVFVLRPFMFLVSSYEYAANNSNPIPLFCISRVFVSVQIRVHVLRETQVIFKSASPSVLGYAHITI